jgi:hypothetical protein
MAAPRFAPVGRPLAQSTSKISWRRRWVKYEQPGAWRVGLECETSQSSYPWRWALGTAENLNTEDDPTNDNVYLYLMPGQRVVVWGAVRLTNIVPTRNPQACYAGLIHEGVEVSLQNSRVGPRSIFIAEQ